jgi:hypothetical protein
MLFQNLKPLATVGERPNNVFLHRIYRNTQLFGNGFVTFMPEPVQYKNFSATRRQISYSLLQNRQSLLSIHGVFRCPPVSQTIGQIVIATDLTTTIPARPNMIENQITGHLKQKRPGAAKLIPLCKTENTNECVMHQVSRITTRQLLGDKIVQHIAVVPVEDGNINFIVFG